MAAIATIIPLLDGEAWIEDTLAAIAAQTLRPAEVVVVDRGSTDGAVERLRQRSDLKLVERPGMTLEAARQEGLEQAAQPLAVILDAQRFHPDHLQRLVQALEQAPDAAAAFSELDRNHHSNPPLPSPTEPRRLDLWEHFPLNPVATPAQVLFRRDRLLEVGGWETRYAGLGDYHAWLTLSSRRPLVHVPGATVYPHPASGPTSHGWRRRNRWEACDRFLSAVQDRVALRLRYHPADATRVRGQMRLARHLLAWRFADAMLSPRQSAPLALEVDKLLAVEPRANHAGLFDLAFAFFPADEGPTRLRHAMGMIRTWRRCPREARHLRQALRQHLQRRMGGAPQPTPDR